MSNDNLNTQLVTGVARIGYVHLLEKAPSMNGEMKYSCEVYIPKSDKATMQKINNCVANAIKMKWGNKTPKNLYIPIRDGDEAGQGGVGNKNVEPGEEPYGGHYFFSASNSKEITVMNSRKEPIIDESLKSGDYGHVSLSFYAYDNPQKKGVGVSLRGFMKTSDGESLGGDFDASGDFDAIEVTEQEASDNENFLGF